MSEHPVCETCQHYVGDSIDGHCRRYPPMKRDVSPRYWEFPRVQAFTFCGEWKPLQIKGR